MGARKADMETTEDYITRARNDPRTADELIEESVSAAGYRNSQDDVLSGTYWNPVRILHFRADAPTMAAANNLFSSENGAERVLAADILAQVAVGDETRGTEAADILLPIFEQETDVEVLGAIACAFGFIKDARCIPRLVQLSIHPDETVRYEVVLGLSGHDEESAIAALIVLSSDADEDVRNWATFGLGKQTEVGTPELRNALIARLSDPDDETRHEALVGLALRGDTRVVPAFFKELKSAGSAEELEDWYLITEAAIAVIQAAKNYPDARWCLLLEELMGLEIGDPSEARKAIKGCQSVRLRDSLS